MRVLIVYHSFTGQAALVAERARSRVEERGHDAVPVRISYQDPAEPTRAPVPFSVIKRWSDEAKQALDVPITCDPASWSGHACDAAVILSNTWSMRPSVPIQSFLRGPGAAALRGLPVGIGIVCRGFWKDNLKLTRGLVEAAGGTVVTTEVFTHAGSWLGSTITNVFGMTKATPPARLGPFRLPPFGVSPGSLVKVAGFVDRCLDDATMARVP